MGEKSYKRIGAVGKAAEILRYLSRQKQPAVAAEIACALEIPRATCLSYIYTLMDEGLVDRDGDGFELGQDIAAMWARRCAIIDRRINTMIRQRDEIAAAGDQ